jgi:serine/threonine protein kinase
MEPQLECQRSKQTDGPHNSFRRLKTNLAPNHNLPNAALNRNKIRLPARPRKDPSKTDIKATIHQPYNHKKEINRCDFTIGTKLGFGHFGSVFEGDLHHQGSSTRVAIKTPHNMQLDVLLGEIRILGQLDNHPNLVNMIHYCIENNQLWLLLEYCSRGDLKHFLVTNRTDMKCDTLKCTNNKSRWFLKWAHEIAKGMQYVSSKSIMHGDLAARNIMLDHNLIAKVSDFGLSKTMYKTVDYRKKKRLDVPWQWMAIEYLTSNIFTMKSDVWSYGILLWELLSLGEEPYYQQNIEEAITLIKDGHKLPFPQTASSISWSAFIYEEVMRPSWLPDISERINFDEIVAKLEEVMIAGERQSMMIPYNGRIRRQGCEDMRVPEKNSTDCINQWIRCDCGSGANEANIQDTVLGAGGEMKVVPASNGYVTLPPAMGGVEATRSVIRQCTLWHN